jgi:hypothetical protein
MGAWKKTTITIDGSLQEAIAPILITASRSTDIPAFYSDWLVNRLKAGWCAWNNPYNGRRQVVSFEAVRLFGFFSKNPAPLMARLDEFDRRGLNYYFHFTLNDYDREKLEPGVPPVENRLAIFKILSKALGPDRVVWRFDPLLITGQTPPEVLLEKVQRLGHALKGLTRKLVISFADIECYKRVGRNLREAGFKAREFSPDERLAFARELGRAAAGWGMEVGACAEAGEDLTLFGIRPNRCMDDELMRRLFPRDCELMAFLNGPNIKDSGQRKACECVKAKDIGHYCTCPHQCAYCYANASPRQALLNHRRHDALSPILLASGRDAHL